MILRSDRRLLDHAETNAFASVPGFLGWRPNKNKMKQNSVFPGRGYFPPSFAFFLMPFFIRELWTTSWFSRAMERHLLLRLTVQNAGLRDKKHEETSY